MIKDVQFEDGKYGRRAIIRSAWSAEMIDYLLANEVVELELNLGKGWRGTDLSFLEELPHLQSFEILASTISSAAPIHSLHGLRTLTVLTYCKSEIRFSAFPQLEECSLEWRPKAASLFECTTLRKLFVNGYKGKDVAPFAELVNLESLAIMNAPVHKLHGLSALKRLRSLRLGGLRRLDSLAGIEGLTNLEELKVQTCRAIRSIEEVGSLSKLRKLELSNDGDIETLKPLDKLDCLEVVGFVESTNILDGDLSPLCRKNLKRVSFQNRRHYSHRREDFGAAYSR
jgi:Leucine-rich repeat (LRR) protein